MYTPVRIFTFCIILLFINPVHAQLSGGGEANPNLHTNAEALEKFKDLRFGMFIHWGPVTLRGTEISWSRGKEVYIADYDSLYKEFNPVLFNADAWVKTAKDAGMKYLVFTAKHHDGFSLWDSQYTNYDITNTPYKIDVIKALAEACKKQNIVFGLYFSICDWYSPDYPVKYPAVETEVKYSDAEITLKMENHISHIKNQLKELIDNYDPAFIWFDGEWEWAWTHEMGMDLYSYLRGLKNNLLINNRVDKGREGMSGTTKSPNYAGDYATPEQEVGSFDNKNAWETCMTIANQWSWKANDKLKSKDACIKTLIETIGGDGNLLFNVGPMADGRIEQRQINRLKEMGEWLKINSAAVYGTRGGPYLPTENMVSTHKNNTIYLLCLNAQDNQLTLPFPSNMKLKKAYLLAGNISISVKQHKNSITLSIPKTMPIALGTVIALDINKPAHSIALIKP